MRNIAIVDGFRTIQSCEDPSTIYAEFPDGLRLIFREGKYVGHYIL